MERGLVVIAGGGGGIPVFNDHDITKGVEAVIDKDLTSAILALQLKADLFVIATDVDRVCLDLQEADPASRGHPDARRNADDILAAGQFPAGSMGPKISAAMVFVERGG